MARWTDCETVRDVSKQLDSLAPGRMARPGAVGMVVTDQGGILLLVRSRHDFDAAVGTDDEFLFGECDGFTRGSRRVGLLLGWRGLVWGRLRFRIEACSLTRDRKEHKGGRIVLRGCSEGYGSLLKDDRC